MNKLKLFFNKLWTDESGQGMAEYILLLVIVVGGVMAFKDPIMRAIKGKSGEIESSIGSFNNNP